MRIYRRFLDLEDGQIHYREAGLKNTVKVLMLHASPGSSKQLEPLIMRLAENFHVFAPDTLGNGDSMAPLQEQPEIADYANVMIEFLERLKLNKVHLYGTHTGARIATYLALRHGARIDRVILDGFGLYKPDSLDEILKIYAPEMEPDQQGLHVLKVWQLCRDQYIWFPWFKKEALHRVPHDLPNAEFLHSKFVEVIKGLRSYHKSYLAAFRYSMREYVPQLRHTTLITCADNDLVRGDFDEAAILLAGADSCSLPGTRSDAAAKTTADYFTQFLLRKQS